jgi:hypothetical protein
VEGGEIRTEVTANEMLSADHEISGHQKLRATTWAYNTLTSNTREAQNKFCQKMKSLIELVE